MTGLVLNAYTARQLESYVEHPAHALLVTGSEGIGKGAVVRQLIVRLLAIEPEHLQSYPYFIHLEPENEHLISVEAIRDLQHDMTLKLPTDSGLRIALIEGAQYLSAEAQNALLKLLEEPPENTFLLMTARHEHDLLPTVRSRVQVLPVKRPSPDELRTHFTKAGYPAEATNTALLMSGGLPGLMKALLDGSEDHPLVAATGVARILLQKNTYERLLMVETLAKQRRQSLDVVFILQQMADIALRSATQGSGAALERWQRVLTAAYRAEEALIDNAQPKLVLTNLMLEL